MHAAGIIAEYNPFHRGHSYHAEQARKLSGADAVVAVMSGHFTQRGDIAVMDKWHRAEAAVSSGVDLVLELPAVFAVRSAQYFAAGGVRLMQKLGIVRFLSFGAEEADLELLGSAADAFEDPVVIEKLKRNLKDGQTYAAALAQALSPRGRSDAGFMTAPNNILGIEYLRALKKYAPDIVPLPVHRIGSHYHATELSGDFPSATAIRREMHINGFSPAVRAALPPASAAKVSELFRTGWAPADATLLDSAVLAVIRRMTDSRLHELPELSEGLENRLRKAADQSGTLAGLLQNLKSKRYPLARLQRLAAHILLGTTPEQLAFFDGTGPLYARVLAMNRRGQAALRAVSRHGGIPVITKTTACLNTRAYHSGPLTPLQSMLSFDIAATDLFSLCLPAPENRKGGLDFCRSAIPVVQPQVTSGTVV